VATFVRKLVPDLSDDIGTDDSIAPEDKARVSVMTLHSLDARLLDPQSGGRPWRAGGHRGLRQWLFAKPQRLGMAPGSAALSPFR